MAVGRPRTVSDAAILAAAMRVIGEVGPARMTLADVAREAGLAAPTLVQRFGSKRGLLLALSEPSVVRLAERFEQARERHGSPLAALSGALTGMVGAVSEPEAFSNHLAFLQLELSDPEFHRNTLAYTRALRDELERLLGEAVAAGELRAGADTAALARSLQVAYNGALITWAIYREGTLEAWLARELEAVLAPWRNL
jgi:AcrR family transcriptional regulator